MSEHLTIGSGLHRLADAIFALVTVIQEGIAEDKAYRASLTEKRTALVLKDGVDWSPHG